MTVEIKVPAMGESVTEATVARWFKKEGDSVSQGEPLLDIETDKAVVEIESPASGLLAGVTARIGSTVYDGSVRGRLAGMRKRLAAN